MTARRFLRSRAKASPGFRAAVVADARAAAGNMGVHRGRETPVSELWLVMRMLWAADAFGALLLVRLGIKLRAFGVPVLPTLLRRLAVLTAQVDIGAPVILGPGLYLPHGKVVIDGLTTVGRQAVIRPFVTIGLLDGSYLGPSIGAGVSIGTGAKLLGPVVIGDRAKIGANAVVLQDVPDRVTAVGVPARLLPIGAQGSEGAQAEASPGSRPRNRAGTEGR